MRSIPTAHSRKIPAKQMNNGIFIGIDTSNYTTSLSAVSEEGEVVANIKRLLPVAQGERGLRQSDAVFSHIKAIPTLAKELSDSLDAYLPPEKREIKAVGFSSAPRDLPGSYMPCFLVGQAVASTLACAAGVPLLSFSHQAGHVMAALYSAGATELIKEKFAAFHVSGGTTDLLLCEPDSEKILKITELGKSLDINAGQAIDRAGVMMGMSFPCGPELEAKAKEYSGPRRRVNTCVKGLNCNLSGLENMASKIYAESSDVRETASFVFDFISETLFRMSENLREEYPAIPIVYAGGVMSSSIIRERLSVFGGYHAEARFSSDNASGCALLCREKYGRNNDGRD